MPDLAVVFSHFPTITIFFTVLFDWFALVLPLFSVPNGLSNSFLFHLFKNGLLIFRLSFQIQGSRTLMRPYLTSASEQT